MCAASRTGGAHRRARCSRRADGWQRWRPRADAQEVGHRTGIAVEIGVLQVPAVDDEDAEAEVTVPPETPHPDRGGSEALPARPGRDERARAEGARAPHDVADH